MRLHNRQSNQLRPTTMIPQYNPYAEGSCKIQCGDTIVLCNATVENKVPSFLRGTGNGWITAEYGMLPRSTAVRVEREAIKGRQSGRTQEIQRLIGRSLRAVTNLSQLEEKQIKIDCDVLQADGGTRTAAITGSYVALYFALQHLVTNNLIKTNPLKMGIAAVSCGIVAGEPLLDLNYLEDSNADVDANFVITSVGDFVELQITGEKNTASATDVAQLITLAQQGIKELLQLQTKVITEYENKR
ncbi:Ribonuclease PH [Candidatus Hepatincola sp. Pdp]